MNSYHTFSFGQYQDVGHMGFRALRVINDDRVAAGAGFQEHGHQDMEILTWVLAGEFAHRDSLGHEQRLYPGELQAMTAGTGIRHSEFNPSDDDEVHFLQIWLLPEAKGLEPRYQQKAFSRAERLNRLCRVASRKGLHGGLEVEADVELFIADIDGRELTHELRSGRHAWVHVARGEATFNGGTRLAEGDAVAVSSPGAVRIGSETEAEVLLFDLG